MPDIFTKTKRSALMSRIRSSGNKDTELRLAALLRAHRVNGWRRNYTLPRRLPGKPDFVFPAQRLALFVDGCYWHGCPRHYRRPKTHRPFWDAKIARNRQRDREVNRRLRAAGWRVLRVWEHALAPKHAPRTLARIQRALAKRALAA